MNTAPSGPKDVGVGSIVCSHPTITTILWQIPVRACLGVFGGVLTSMVGAGGYVAIGFHHFLALPPLIIGAVAGAWLGVRLRDHTPDAPLQAGFAILMVIVASQLIVDATNIY